MCMPLAAASCQCGTGLLQRGVAHASPRPVCVVRTSACSVAYRSEYQVCKTLKAHNSHVLKCRISRDNK